MTTHVLKSWPAYFNEVQRGTKTFELRQDDRGYKVGDTLRLREWEPPLEGDRDVDEKTRYSGRECTVVVTHIARPVVGDLAVLGLRPGWVCMSIRKQ